MWHWNSLWAPAPGDPPAVDDPLLWRTPWSAEQAFALQARSWETMLSATHSWWTMLLSAWPVVPTAWPGTGLAAPAPDHAASTGIEPLAAPPVKRKTAPRKRSTTPVVRHAKQARHR